MKKVFDLLLGADLDLDVRGGDFAIGESTKQHQGLILETEKGEWRENPAVGVGITSMLLDDAAAGDIMLEIQQQMEADGQTISQLTVTADKQLSLIASYS